MLQGHWIAAGQTGDVCPVLRRRFVLGKAPALARLRLTACGVYEALLNGVPVTDSVLNPGWTSYHSRLQVQAFDVAGLRAGENELQVTLGKGWYHSPLGGWVKPEDKPHPPSCPLCLKASLELEYPDGSRQTIDSDAAWEWAEGPTRFSEIYDGETHDARIEPRDFSPVRLVEGPDHTLIPHEGEPIREMARVRARRVFQTPAGETLVDFGQVVTGYAAFTVKARAGERVRFTHGEVLDKAGNFYNANYRGAKALVDYTCKEGEQTWHPRLTFFGFRYLRLDAFPGTARPEQFTAIAVHSDMPRTGFLRSSDTALNRFFDNVLWGQRGNFLDVPTDCPQRDERLGWTGDAQVFVRAAACYYDVARFFDKWLKDLAADQQPNGGVGVVIPDVLGQRKSPPSAAWGDAATIVPWQLYQSYGDDGVLRRQYRSMLGWLDYIASVSKTPDLWTGCWHYGDWLSLDAPGDSCTGASRLDFIASAFYAHSTDLCARTARLIGEDAAPLEALHRRIVAAFRKEFPEYLTQTEHVLALHMNLTEQPQKTADALARMIREDGGWMRTGFVGTPYLLHVLSEHGHADLAWQLLLWRDYPSWLYPVSKGATTVWEHWDGIKPDGSFWSEGMNSFNHYAYGAVVDWVFARAAGILVSPNGAGGVRVKVAPCPSRQLDFLDASLNTRAGRVSARWEQAEGGLRLTVACDMPVAYEYAGELRELPPGEHILWALLPAY